jgi:hypothetical protein
VVSGQEDKSITPEEKREALDRVLRSQTFARADQLKKFLHYVCTMEMGRRVEEISEYSIAVDALGRRADYSPGDDSTVRDRARDLRLKLQQFYHLECPGESIRINLQKGSYAPTFLRAAPADSSPAVPATAPSKTTHVAHRHKLPAKAVIACAVVSGVTLAAIFGFMRHGGTDPILAEFWGPLLLRDANVLLCVASPTTIGFKRFQEAPRAGRFRPAPPEIATLLSDAPSLDGGTLPYLFAVDSPTFGDAAAAVIASRYLSAAGVPFQLIAESSVRPAVLRDRNVLLIGAPSYSTYAARALRSTPFTIRSESAKSEEAISDGTPDLAPKRIFTAKRDASGALSVAYGLISVFGSQAAMGQGPRTVIFSGITGAGSQAAMEFFSSSAGLGLLRDRLRKDGYQRVPSSYQVVVRCTIDRSLLMNWDFAAYQVIERPPMFE